MLCHQLSNNISEVMAILPCVSFSDLLSVFKLEFLNARKVLTLQKMNPKTQFNAVPNLTKWHQLRGAAVRYGSFSFETDLDRWLFHKIVNLLNHLDFLCRNVPLVLIGDLLCAGSIHNKITSSKSSKR